MKFCLSKHNNYAMLNIVQVDSVIFYYTLFWPHTFVSHRGSCQYVHEVLVNRLGGLSLPRKSVIRLTGRPDMTLDVYRGRKTTTQQQQQQLHLIALRTAKTVLGAIGLIISGELLIIGQAVLLVIICINLS